MKRLPELLWDHQQTAAALGISKRCLQYWAAGNRVPGFVLMNGRPRWQRAVIEQWIQAGCPEVRKAVQIDANDEADIRDSGDRE